MRASTKLKFNKDPDIAAMDEQNASTKQYFADLPIYRIAEEKYNIQQKEFIDKHRYYDLKYDDDILMYQDFFRRYPERKSKREYDLWKSFGGDWKFNEIIGYIRLYFSERHLEGELWFVDAKRITRTRKKHFVCKTPSVSPGKVIPKNATDQDIFSLICEYLQEVRKGSLKKYIVDSNCFERIGKFVAWNKLITS